MGLIHSENQASLSTARHQPPTKPNNNHYISQTLPLSSSLSLSLYLSTSLFLESSPKKGKQAQQWLHSMSQHTSASPCVAVNSSPDTLPTLQDCCWESLLCF